MSNFTNPSNDETMSATQMEGFTKRLRAPNGPLLATESVEGVFTVRSAKRFVSGKDIVQKDSVTGRPPHDKARSAVAALRSHRQNSRSRARSRQQEVFKQNAIGSATSGVEGDEEEEEDDGIWRPFRSDIDVWREAPIDNQLVLLLTKDHPTSTGYSRVLLLDLVESDEKVRVLSDHLVHPVVTFMEENRDDMNMIDTRTFWVQDWLLQTEVDHMPPLQVCLALTFSNKEEAARFTHAYLDARESMRLLQNPRNNASGQNDGGVHSDPSRMQIQGLRLPAQLQPRPSQPFGSTPPRTGNIQSERKGSSRKLSFGGDEDDQHHLSSTPVSEIASREAGPTEGIEGTPSKEGVGNTSIGLGEGATGDNEEMINVQQDRDDEEEGWQVVNSGDATEDDDDKTTAEDVEGEQAAELSGIGRNVPHEGESGLYESAKENEVAAEITKETTETEAEESRILSGSHADVSFGGIDALSFVSAVEPLSFAGMNDSKNETLLKEEPSAMFHSAVEGDTAIVDDGEEYELVMKDATDERNEGSNRNENPGDSHEVAGEEMFIASHKAVDKSTSNETEGKETVTIKETDAVNPHPEEATSIGEVTHDGATDTRGSAKIFDASPTKEIPTSTSGLFSPPLAVATSFAHVLSEEESRSRQTSPSSSSALPRTALDVLRSASPTLNATFPSLEDVDNSQQEDEEEEEEKVEKEDDFDEELLRLDEVTTPSPSSPRRISLTSTSPSPVYHPAQPGTAPYFVHGARLAGLGRWSLQSPTPSVTSGGEGASPAAPESSEGIASVDPSE